MPLNADGCLVDQTPMSTQSTDIGSHAPPLYGEHILDQLYADIDQSGIMTPAPQSGMNTPFYSQSRSGSSENLASLDTAVHANGAVAPAALSSRLQNLNLSSSSRNNSFLRNLGGAGAHSGGTTPYHVPHNETSNGYFDNNSHSTPSSNPLSRRTSGEDHHPGSSNLASGQHTPEHIDYSELGDLTKVPSYSTAVKAPIRGMSYSDALPNYDTAISTPTSPNLTFSTSATPVAESPASNARRSLRPIQHPMQPPPVHMGDEDERRRLHFLRNRERAH